MFLWFFPCSAVFRREILVLAEITLYYRWSGGHSSAAHRAQLTKRFAMVGTLPLAICKQPICGIGIQQNSPRRHHVPSGEVLKLKPTLRHTHFLYSYSVTLGCRFLIPCGEMGTFLSGQKPNPRAFPSQNPKGCLATFLVKRKFGFHQNDTSNFHGPIYCPPLPPIGPSYSRVPTPPNTPNAISPT